MEAPDFQDGSGQAVHGGFRHFQKGAFTPQGNDIEWDEVRDAAIHDIFLHHIKEGGAVGGTEPGPGADENEALRKQPGTDALGICGLASGDALGGDGME